MRYRWIILFCLVLAHTVTAEVVDINIKEFQTLLASGTVVIDVRTPREWQQTGIVEGSIPIMFFDEKRKSRTQLWMSKAENYSSPDEELILICRSGNRSKLIANFLTQQHGYKRIYNVKDGIKEWLRLGNKTVAP